MIESRDRLTIQFTMKVANFISSSIGFHIATGSSDVFPWSSHSFQATFHPYIVSCLFLSWQNDTWQVQRTFCWLRKEKSLYANDGHIRKSTVSELKWVFGVCPHLLIARHRGPLECSVPKARLARIYCVLDVNFRMLNTLSSSIRVQSYEELFILHNFFGDK